MDHTPETCLRIDQDLALFVGGELEGSAERVVREHLDQCPACRRRERATRSAHAALSDGLRPGARPAPDLWAGVRAGLQREGLIACARPPRAAAPRAWYQRPSFAAAAAVLVLCGSFALRHWIEERDAQPSVPPLAENLPPRSVPTPAEPVAAADGLRRLQSGERPLAEGAELLGGEEFQPLLFSDPTSGSSPVGLQRVPWR